MDESTAVNHVLKRIPTVRHYACEDCRKHFAHFAGVLVIKGHKKSS